MSTTPIETNELEQQSTSLVQQAQQFVIVQDQQQRDDANFLTTALRSMRKTLLEYWDGTESNPGRCAQAYALWKTLVADKKRMLEPVETAIRKVDDEIVQYDNRQEAERRRIETATMLAEKIRQDEAALEQAERLYDSGDEQAAEAVLTQQVHSPAPVVIVPSTVQKVQGESTRSIWRFRVKDVNAIPREYLMPDEIKIGGVVRAMKSQTKIPGIECYEERVRSQRTPSRFGHL